MTNPIDVSAADFVRRPLVSTVEGIDAEMCGWIFRRPEFRALRIAARGAHPKVYSALTAVMVLGNEWADAANGSGATEVTEVAPRLSEWSSVAEVAALLGVTPRRVRQLCQTGRLEAENRGRPIGWRIHREALTHFQTHQPRSN